MTGYKNFEKYAIAHGIHNGPATREALKKLYSEHKGSHYKTIVELFQARGTIAMYAEMNR
jgi:hypothetical protein